MNKSEKLISVCESSGYNRQSKDIWRELEKYEKLDSSSKKAVDIIRTGEDSFTVNEFTYAAPGTPEHQARGMSGGQRAYLSFTKSGMNLDQVKKFMQGSRPLRYSAQG